MLGYVGQELEFTLAQRAHQSSRIAEVQVTGLQHLVGRDQATRADHHAILDDRVVGDDRTHADQALVTDAATVQQHLVTEALYDIARVEVLLPGADPAAASSWTSVYNTKETSGVVSGTWTGKAILMGP